MKKLLSLIIAANITAVLFAGGIITNTNQSATNTRLQAMDATIGIDGVYFNPAGLTLLPNNGLYLSINNQTLGQTRTITSNYSFLNSDSYEGKISAPIFPGIYAAYKMDKLTFSLGFNPIGGGGGGTYDKGLPSFEYGISGLVPMLQGSLAPIDQGIVTAGFPDPGFRNVSGYQADINFEGTSVYFGYQANVSYAINDLISVAIGGRYVSAKETYKGTISNIMINAPAIYGGLQTPGNYLRFVAAQVDPSTAALLNGTAGALDVATEDREVDVEQKATGFTPIISVNIKASEKINLAFKYEHKTKLEFETKVNSGLDGGGMYVDGEKYRYDIPAQIAAGATFKPVEKLMLSTAFHYYLDKNADWEGREDLLDANSWEFAFGGEYTLSEKLLCSLGYLRTQSGASDEYQSDLSFSLPSNSFGGGVAYTINDMFKVNLGGSYTIYEEGSKTFIPNDGIGTPITETYIKPIWIIGVGFDINFSAGK